MSKAICIALKQDGSQCTFKAKDGTNFCGRHAKNSSTRRIVSKYKSSTPLCRGFKTNGDPCANRTSRPSGFCGHHDPNKKKDTELLEMQNKKALQRLKENVEKRIGRKINLNNLYTDRKDISIEESRYFIQEHVHQSARENAILERNNVRYLNNDNTKFPRHIWMIIGEYLHKDYHSYDNLTLTSKKMYQLLCRDKVWHYKHPLQEICIKPALFRMPTYRIIKTVIPNDLNRILKLNDLPSVDEIYKEYAIEHGDIKDSVAKNNMIGDMTLLLLENLIERTLHDEDVFEESVEGCGIFDDAANVKEVKFIKEIKNIIFNIKNTSWLISYCNSFKDILKTHSRTIENLIGFDGKEIIKLIRY